MCFVVQVQHSISEDSAGRPGVWVLEVEGGKVVRWLAPARGTLMADLLRPASSIVHDPRVDGVRALNPAAI